MFKIEELTLFNNNGKSKTYKFFENTFIFGPNNIGKTVFTKTLDYVLGSSKEKLNHEGLDNITSVELAISSNDKICLWVKRSTDGTFAYRRSKNSEYSITDLEGYKSEINAILLDDVCSEHYIDVYKMVFNENISFRAVNFLNYIEEKGLGDLNTIFTKAREIQHQIRITNIMKFFFNYKNIEEIYNKKVQLKELEDKKKQLEPAYQEYKKSTDIIQEMFLDLQIKYSKDFSKLNKEFNKFKANFYRQEPTESPDIIYAAKNSLSLAEEIKLYTFLKNQAKTITKRNENIVRMLNILKMITIKSPKYEQYTKRIVDIIDEINDNEVLLNVTDYTKSIRNIRKEKKEFDKMIEEYKAQARELNYDTVLKKIGIIERCLFIMKSQINESDIRKIDKDIDNLKKSIQTLENDFNKKGIEKFNKDLMEQYFQNNNLSYVEEDKEKKGFSIEFRPISTSLVTSYESYDDKKLRTYIPGSMARQTHLQILTYLCMFKYLKQEFKGFCFMPLLIIDSAGQPFDDNNFEKVYSNIINFSRKIGIQTIVLSKKDIENIPSTNKIIFTRENGFNPFHKK